MSRAVIGMGSNLGDRFGNIKKGLHAISLLRIGRTSCVFQPVRDTAKSDKGASIKSLEG